MLWHHPTIMSWLTEADVAFLRKRGGIVGEAPRPPSGDLQPISWSELSAALASYNAWVRLWNYHQLTPGLDPNPSWWRGKANAKGDRLVLQLPNPCRTIVVEMQPGWSQQQSGDGRRKVEAPLDGVVWAGDGPVASAPPATPKAPDVEPTDPSCSKSRRPAAAAKETKTSARKQPLGWDNWESTWAPDFDPALDALRDLLRVWEDGIGIGVAVTSKQLLNYATGESDDRDAWPPTKAAALRDAIRGLLAPRVALSTRSIGHMLSRHSRRSVNGRRLVMHPDRRTAATFTLQEDKTTG